MPKKPSGRPRRWAAVEQNIGMPPSVPEAQPFPEEVASDEPGVINLPGYFNYHPVQTIVGPWLVCANVTEHKGRLIVSRLEVRLVPGEAMPLAGLSSRDLRLIQLPDAVEAAQRAEDRLHSLIGLGKFTPKARARLKAGPSRDPRRWARGEGFYAQVADDYLRARKKKPGHESVWLTELYLKKGYAEATQQKVTSWVSLARNRYGFLTEAPGRGQPGGEATDKLKAWRESRDRKPRRKRS